MSRIAFTMLVLFALAFSACSAAASVPTATNPPLPTETVAPTASVAPTATSTEPVEVPTAVSSPTEPAPTEDAVESLLPEGTPAAEWGGFPIMPGAISGSGNEQGYTFTIKATAQEVQDFYQAELEKMGYSMFASGGGDSKEMIMLIFMKDSEVFSVSIIPNDDVLLVLLVK